MWVIGFLLLFISVLLLTTRKSKEYYTGAPEPSATHATLPIVVKSGIPYAILPQEGPVRLSFGGNGLSGRLVQTQGIQEVYLGGSRPVKMPVRLARGGEETTFGVLRYNDSSVRTVVVDMSTLQLHLRGDAVIPAGKGIPYHLTSTGNVELEGESSRLGNITLSLDDTHSVGYAGDVACAGSTMRIHSSIPGMKTSIGARDMTAGKRRFIFDIADGRVLVE